MINILFFCFFKFQSNFTCHQWKRGAITLITIFLMKAMKLKIYPWNKWLEYVSWFILIQRIFLKICKSLDRTNFEKKDRYSNIFEVDLCPMKELSVSWSNYILNWCFESLCVCGFQKKVSDAYVDQGNRYLDSKIPIPGLYIFKLFFPTSWIFNWINLL